MTGSEEILQLIVAVRLAGRIHDDELYFHLFRIDSLYVDARAVVYMYVLAKLRKAGFDHDGYKILCRPVLSGQYDIIELRPENGPASS